MNARLFVGMLLLLIIIGGLFAAADSPFGSPPADPAGYARWKDLCAPNHLDTCWSFSIAVGPPSASIVEPLESTYTSCAGQHIIINLWDADVGVDMLTVQLYVQGVLYGIGSPELTYDAGTNILEFTPSVLFADGEAVYSATIGIVSGLEDYAVRQWDGKDKSGNKLPEGLYLYVIKVSGEMTCNGTLVIVR